MKFPRRALGFIPSCGWEAKPWPLRTLVQSWGSWALANSIVSLISWRKKLNKQVPQSLYQTLYTARVTRAHPLLICDLVLEEHQGSWRQHFRNPGKCFRNMILGDLGTQEMCSPEAKGCLPWCSSSKDLEGLSWEASRTYSTQGSCVAVIRNHRMISAGFYSCTFLWKPWFWHTLGTWEMTYVSMLALSYHFIDGNTWGSEGLNTYPIAGQWQNRV